MKKAVCIFVLCHGILLSAHSQPAPVGQSVMPAIGAWFWSDSEFEPEGYKYVIDHVADHSAYSLLSTAIRIPGRDITDIDVYNQVKKAVEYAHERGVGIAMELDARVARRKFEALYPNDLQESLWLTEVSLSAESDTETVVKSIDLSDHMTGRRVKYLSLRGSLQRVYAYRKTADGLIDPASLRDISQESAVVSSARDSLIVRLPARGSGEQEWACAMVSFTLLTPDLFSPRLFEFQREIIRNYADIPLAGGMLDEWGFPPSTPPDRLAIGEHFWYSKNYAAAYAEKTGGRELLHDCLLMAKGVAGEESTRLGAINHYMALNLERNTAFEHDFYQTVKEVFGPDAAVVTHATWWPYPDRLEMKKNGLHWWAATRDWAQSDETTPFAARTAMAKKWGSPVWYNQYYNFVGDANSSYQTELWSAALAGGRINFHPTYPNTKPMRERHVDLMRGGLVRGHSRIRLLDLISDSPLHSPVAIVFGHTAAMNWAGPYFEGVGMEMVDSLWSQGIPTDLIPTSEIQNGSLAVDEEGWVRYGRQRYAAVILYHPEFETSATADFFRQAAEGRTQLYRVGSWTRGFDGQEFAGDEILPSSLVPRDPNTILATLKKRLPKLGIVPQTPANRQTGGFARQSHAPPSTGFAQLIDGTHIHVAGTVDAAGDPIQLTRRVGKFSVTFDALGIAAVRLDAQGNVAALAAGGLQSFKTKAWDIQLDERVDVAIWKDANGAYQGLIQGWNGPVPPPLLAITQNWEFRDLPEPLAPNSN